MQGQTLFAKNKLSVSPDPPYDPLMCFVRENHIAKKGADEGLLSGYVFSAKDVFTVKGSTFGNGHPDYLKWNEPDSFTATGIEVLLNEGADLVGKTICDELCYSISGENWHYGSPLNPYDVRRYTGGSSSGSCASVAGNLVDFSIGSDCLGSVRVPASYTNLYGMRPTLNRVDNTGEALYCESMDVLGYVAKEAKVFQKVSQVLLGKDEHPFNIQRLWFPKDLWGLIEEDILASANKVLNKLKAGPYEVIEDEFAPEIDEWVHTFQVVQGYEVWDSYKDFIQERKPFVSPGPQGRLNDASKITKSQYKEHKKKMQAIARYVHEQLKDDTLLILPTASSIAPLRTDDLMQINADRAKSSKFLCISALSGTPQLTLPWVFYDEAPFGISFIGPQGADQTMINIALSFE